LRREQSGFPWRWKIRPSCFFSSKRRHTRFSRDWSSDVCSSDLQAKGPSAAEVSGKQVSRASSLEPHRRSKPIAPDARPGESLRRSEERRVGKKWLKEWYWQL